MQTDKNSVNNCDIRGQVVWKKAAKEKLLNIPHSLFKLFSCSTIKLAFTLAEVIITLGIIGIVAEVTIPTLINSINKQQYVASLEKFYTNFNQVLLQITNDYGCIGDLVCTGLFSTGKTTLSLGDELTKYFKVSKNCHVDNNDYTCMPSNYKLHYDGTVDTGNYIHVPFYKFVTIDGTSVIIQSMTDYGGGSDCKTVGGTGNLTNVCAYIYVDLNGTKGPNYSGRDFFQFYISNGRGPKLYPAGGSDDSLPWTTGCATNGAFCAGRIIEEGWQMNY